MKYIATLAATLVLLAVTKTPAAATALIIDAAARAQVLFSDEHLPEPPAGAGRPPVSHSE